MDLTLIFTHSKLEGKGSSAMMLKNCLCLQVCTLDLV